MPLYIGPTLIEYLEEVEIDSSAADLPFRFQVQLVNRPNLDFRGFSGTIASGEVSVGDEILVAGSGERARLRSIVTYDGELASAKAGQAVTLLLDKEIDISRGDVICTPLSPPETADQFQAQLIWMSDAPLIRGRTLLIKLGANTVSGSVTQIRHKTDVNTFATLAVETVKINEVALVNFSTTEPIVYDP